MKTLTRFKRIITSLQCGLRKKIELICKLKNKEPFFHLKNKSNHTYRNIWKPLGFTVAFSGATFIGATICEYERIRKQTYKAFNYVYPKNIEKSGWRREKEIWWNNLSDGQRLFAPIFFLNLLVFLAWRVPNYRGIMIKYFISGPNSSILSMVLSTFSHNSFLHLATNMYVLYSFSPSIAAVLGKEQFTAFYLFSGVISSLTSVFYKNAFGKVIPSLGASGAILGIIGFFCMYFPNGELSIIFLPMYSFSASMAFKALIGFDLTGCLLGWKFFDHAAHLGGILTGIFWHQWGNEYIWKKRESIIKIWDSIRN